MTTEQGVARAIIRELGRTPTEEELARLVEAI